ncbi:plasmid mobilization protein [Taylorella equigenitalis]|uniref:plasmid mobilization protein n=1 Tax=Taylorella equigenitalis TaxID=29575 RepID=UPI000BACBE26|nr:plasmid mobilization relaxosome protein MobC [Taylorella equigenitalis]ASY39391.1 hypothetical protein CA604_04545 [Taylorella equigenitalis]WDU48754.1 plasmid mobilization relaxosome protein MobC [Taylorella equigenitalis]WDU51229.1 plasmid mobilization relaxosome protein MobC [Taylorella equigenitalis]WDU55718.1 plasmid mobilization relaxosome protein MobC [Taylorella equigenitalis]
MKIFKTHLSKKTENFSSKNIKKIRDKELKIRLTYEEKEAIKKRSTRPQIAVWAREVLLNEKIYKPYVSADPKLVVALNKIGNNFNQIVKKLHSIQHFDAYSLGEFIDGIEKIYKEFLQVKEKCL